MQTEEITIPATAMQPVPAQAAAKAVPAFFRMNVPLPKQGRQDTLVAATDRMRVVMKTYAAGGENGLHAHTNEDHVFMVLQGRVEFYGPNGEIKAIGRNEGVMLPRGTFYWFQCVSEEPLVMIRVGAVDEEESDPLRRINTAGEIMDPFSTENKEVPLILGDKVYG